MTNYIGEIAGIATSMLYALNAVLITKATRQVGPAITNRVRVAFALFYLMALNLIFFQQPLPFDSGADRWMWLSLSGIIGLALGDLFLFQSFVLVGARIGTLLLSLSTVFSVLEAWFFFDEILSLPQIAGIALALAGIVWVILEPGRDDHSGSRNATLGIMFGTLSAFCQATGFVISKLGMQGNFSPFQANAIRMAAALLALLVIMSAQKQTRLTFRILRENKSALGLLSLAALIGPVLGVSLSLLSVQRAEVGVASVLTSLTPVFMLPVSYFLFRERFHWQAIAGTTLAMMGVAILFLY